ncbi:SH3 domain-containing protein [Chryseobacterium sp. RLHN22]|uniref:SH3 domain-containing protein n=1 Tax=Chryseobacterium sp. RLHN22 TaxID=3437885 RepID=UPI003D9B7C07
MKILYLIFFLCCIISCEGQKTKSQKCNIDKAIIAINGLEEVQKQNKYVDSISDNKKKLSFMTDSLEINHHLYYRIKTGLNSEFHWETYTIFYVDKNDCSTIMVDEVISGNIITLNKWRLLNNKTKKNMNTNNNSINNAKFSDLFNESSNIKFTPHDLNKNTSEIENFKHKLISFESNDLDAKDFDINNLSLLINNETFSNNEKFIDSSWLRYFIDKYNFNPRVIDNLMKIALKQEDYHAVKILSKNYIFSKKQIDEAVLKNKYKNTLKGKLDTEEYYDPTYSMIDKILPFIEQNYYKNHIQDPDGFTNLRKDKTPTSEILQKIKSGEHIEVLDNSGDWFLVKTKEGREGYVHKSRIKN